MVRKLKYALSNAVLLLGMFLIMLTVFFALAVRQSKCKHLVGTVASRKLHIENIRNVSHVIPGESDMFHANRTFCAVPLSGSGGLIAIFKVSVSLQPVCSGTCIFTCCNNRRTVRVVCLTWVALLSFKTAATSAISLLILSTTTDLSLVSRKI